MRKGVREHFGRGRLAFDPPRAVFINCPFDSEFQPLFDAILFATVCCGFIPRSARESNDSAEPRVNRILPAIFSSKYSIHDLSRCRGEGSGQLARFNMPLELGMAMARRYMAARKSQQHDWLLLVPEGHVYQKFISDLAGFDPLGHDGTVASVVSMVMSWLATRPDAAQTLTPIEALAVLPVFQSERDRLRRDWGPNLPWADLVLAAIEIYRGML